MKISEFESLIRNLPVDSHSSSIRKKNWQTKPQKPLIDKVFANNSEVINVSRGELLTPPSNLREFALKVLLWGYPTGGRGNNIKSLLTEENFATLLVHLEKCRTSKEINIKEIRGTIDAVPGLGLSTMSKYLYFLRVNTEGFPSMILDKQIINVVKSNRFEELAPLGKMRNESWVSKFREYLRILNSVSKELNVRNDQVEMFLIVFGKILFRG